MDANSSRSIANIDYLDIKSVTDTWSENMASEYESAGLIKIKWRKQMHHTHAIQMANLGANITIGEESGIHHTYALQIVKIVASKGGNVVIEKSYHHTQIAEMVTAGGNNVTVKI
jgi:hypothetical protein